MGPFEALLPRDRAARFSEKLWPPSFREQVINPPPNAHDARPSRRGAPNAHSARFYSRAQRSPNDFPLRIAQVQSASTPA